MTYGQIRETIRDVCSPKTVREIKLANRELNKILGDLLFSISKQEDAFSTIVWYEVKPSDEELTCVIGYDFWNGRVVA